MLATGLAKIKTVTKKCALGKKVMKESWPFFRLAFLFGLMFQPITNVKGNEADHAEYRNALPTE